MDSLMDSRIEAYATDHSTEEPELLQQLALETHEQMDHPQMLTGPLEGSFLHLLVLLLRARNILEIGMFTGYSALWMASALPDDGKLVTCEVNPEAEAIARRYFKESPHGAKITIQMGLALTSMRTLKEPFDLVFIDADKENYPCYYEKSMELLRPGGIIVIDNVLWSGRTLSPQDAETRAIHEVNEQVRNDKRVDKVLVPMRDGVLLVRKKQ